MNPKFLRTLEYDKILEQLTAFARHSETAERIRAIVPATDFRTVRQMLSETDAAYTLLIKYGIPDLLPVDGLSEQEKRLNAGGTLSMAELLNIRRILKNVRLLQSLTAEQTGVLEEEIASLYPDKALETDIENAILSEDEIADRASSELASIRRKLQHASNKIKDSLDSMIHSSHYRKLLQEPIVTMRRDRYVIPVKAEYRNEVKGLVHDISSSGGTVFIEPESVVNANNELHTLEAAEENEIRRILAEFSARAAEICDALVQNYETLLHLDTVFAKARMALDMKGVCPTLSDGKILRIQKGRHPLIDRKKIVPTTVYLGDEFDTLVVTGPNTGGKTVVLKTIGLFCLMAQSGMFIPATDGSCLPVYDNIFADIGDEQSIEQNLSTFSAHLKNIVTILKHLTPKSLVLFDELGAGTDPTEGAALATAILEHVRTVGAACAATTHYSELKLYALSTDGVENASCEFDVETLSPTYRLLIGIPGKSNAFAISEKLGLSPEILRRSRELLSGDALHMEDILSDMEQSRLQTEKDVEESQQMRREIERLKQQLEQEREAIEKKKDKIFDRAREKADKLIARAQQETEEMLAAAKAAKEKEDSAAAMREMENIRRELGLKQKKNRPPKHKTAPPKGKRPDIRRLKPGTSVMLNDLGDKGSVLSVNEKDGTVLVQVGIMKVTAKIENLSLAEEETPKTPMRYTGSTSGGGLRKTGARTELDLRGRMLEEALYETDQFLDEAYLGGLNTVSIIHGKGTGTLRNGIQQMLRKHPQVKSFRPGRYGEGENGVTIVELK